MKTKNENFYNSNRPFDGGSAIVEEIQKLRRRIAEAPKNGRRRETLRARERRYLTELCENLAGLISEAANGCYQKLGRYVGYSEGEDLVNDAYAALLSKAIDDFDGARGVKFSTFAHDRAKGGCYDKVNRQDHYARKTGKQPKMVFLSHDALAEMSRACYRDLDLGDREMFDHIDSLAPCDRDILLVIKKEMTLTEYIRRWECTDYMAKKHREAVRGYYRAWAEGERHLPDIEWSPFRPRKAAAAGDRNTGRGQIGPDVSRKIEGSRDQAA